MRPAVRRADRMMNASLHSVSSMKRSDSDWYVPTQRGLSAATKLEDWIDYAIRSDCAPFSLAQFDNLAQKTRLSRLVVQKIIGDELRLIQFGGMPKDAKPFKGVGSGVLEIALRYDAEAYRTVLAVQLGEKIYILHAFQKKSKKGIETTKHDVNLIKQRYVEARERANHEE